jgi:hypothetical protein
MAARQQRAMFALDYALGNPALLSRLSHQRMRCDVTGFAQGDEVHGHHHFSEHELALPSHHNVIIRPT